MSRFVHADDQLVAFLKTLTDGYVPQQTVQNNEDEHGSPYGTGRGREDPLAGTHVRRMEADTGHSPHVDSDRWKGEAGLGSISQRVVGGCLHRNGSGSHDRD